MISAYFLNCEIRKKCIIREGVGAIRGASSKRIKSKQCIFNICLKVASPLEFLLEGWGNFYSRGAFLRWVVIPYPQNSYKTSKEKLPCKEEPHQFSDQRNPSAQTDGDPVTLYL